MRICVSFFTLLALKVAIGIGAVYVLSPLFYYLIGAGWIGAGWIFFVGPFLAVATGIWAARSAKNWRCSPALRVGGMGALFAVGFAGVFAFGPSASIGDRFLCRGLAHRLETKASEKLLNEHLQSLLLSKLSAQDEIVNVTSQAPSWLKEAFPERTTRVTFFNGERKHLGVSIGGPYLRYGYYVGVDTADFPGHDDRTVYQTLGSNIVVFAR